MAEGLALLLNSVSRAGLGGPLDDASGFMFYREIHRFLSEALRTYGVNLFERFVSWTGGVVLVLLTLWICTQGYRIMTGQSRESMTVFATEMMKAVLIVSIATGASLGAGNLHEWVSYDLGNLINRLGTGQSTDIFESVDRSLGYMQLAFGVIDGIQVGENRELQNLKDMNMFMVLVGSGIPAIVTGALLLLYEIMAALTLGFAPLFVLCLLFPQTRQLFWGWLYYLLGTLFSLAVLSVMAALAMDVTCAVAAAFWVGKFTGANPEGVNSLALQQGGLGLLLTTLIVTAPRIAAQFFKGILADFSPFSAFGSGTAASRTATPTYAPTYTGGNDHAPMYAQTHALRVATPVRRAAQEDQIKPADDTQSFLERYPNSTASLEGQAGKGDQLPDNLAKSRDAVTSNASSVSIGLGESVGRILGLSPTLQRELIELQKEGWKISFGEVGKGSVTDRSRRHPAILLDGRWEGNDKETLRALVHEVGHAKYQYRADYSSREAYINAALCDEAAAMAKNIQIRREILESTQGKMDIGLNGTAANHDKYNAAYDQYLADGDEIKLRASIGAVFGDYEYVSVRKDVKKSYREYYGEAYDARYGH